MRGYFPECVSVAEKRAKAQKQMEKLRKKNPDIAPILIEGRSIAKTWWAKAWNKNLELYADYSNRISRGRSYVRNGAVLDLQIDTGTVKASVQGSRSKPYQVEVKITPISADKWEAILKLCNHRIDSIGELVAGKFPQELAEVFTLKGQGLFPTDQEIEFSCSCPDWASMCKHVSATLYGIGARFDEDPILFFKLRNIEFEDLLQKTLEQKMESMLKNAQQKSERVIDEEDVSDLFGL